MEGELKMTILILILLILILLMLIANFYALYSLDCGFPHFGKRDEMKEFIHQGFVNTKGELLHCFGVLCNKIDYESVKLRQEVKQEIAELEERLLPKITPTLVSVWPVTDEKLPLKKTLRKQIMDYLLKNKGKEVHYTHMVQQLKSTTGEISGILSTMVRKGEVIRLRRGVYALPCETVDSINISQ
jgi:hypothetical protein